MDEVISLQGPVEMINGELTLLIPLGAGGDQFVECSRGIGVVEGDYLKIVIRDWLAGTLRVEEGDLVSISNENGKFGIQAVNPRPVN